ncbi:pyruvoyl-dependent arginine decarboxylase [Candidatus Alkanophaga liquidiphilum]|nr:Pyruvoyl-dependent arginine decarboxylase [Candidatus Alkanophaga liquidiphilum]
MLPKKFFVTTGVGMDEDPLNAFDCALRDAGISECNLVLVSSILPRDATHVEPVRIEPGTITFCVLARQDGNAGEIISAGIGYGWLSDDSGRRIHGVVCEHGGFRSKEFVRGKLEAMLCRMAKVRGLNLEEKRIYVESVEVEEGKCGSIVAALVFVPEP